MFESTLLGAAKLASGLVQKQRVLKRVPGPLFLDSERIQEEGFSPSLEDTSGWRKEEREEKKSRRKCGRV